MYATIKKQRCPSRPVELRTTRPVRDEHALLGGGFASTPYCVGVTVYGAGPGVTVGGVAQGSQGSQEGAHGLHGAT